MFVARECGFDSDARAKPASPQRSASRATPWLRSSLRRSSADVPSCGAPAGPAITVPPSSTTSRGSAVRYSSLWTPPRGSPSRSSAWTSPSCLFARCCSRRRRHRPSTTRVFPLAATLNRSPAHSSSGLGHRPLTAAARVRIPYAPSQHAQLELRSLGEHLFWTSRLRNWWIALPPWRCDHSRSYGLSAVEAALRRSAEGADTAR
jgi:hypothetical protein